VFQEKESNRKFQFNLGNYPPGNGVGVLVIVGVLVLVGVRVIVAVRVGTGVFVGLIVLVKVGVRVLVGSGVLLGVKLGVAEGLVVGGIPVIVNLPDTLKKFPLNICTSYSPGSHCEGSGSQST
jgi:hypothetical protein